MYRVQTPFTPACVALLQRCVYAATAGPGQCGGSVRNNGRLTDSRSTQRHLAKRSTAVIAHAEAPDWRQAFEAKERGLALKLDDLKAAAQQRMDELLRDADAVARGNKAQRGDDGGSDELSQLRRAIETAIESMQIGLVERDIEVRLLLLAALAGEHVLYIGPPGTAKSELGRRLSGLCDGTYFERLLTRFSVPEELFGPLSMRALEEDKYIRQTTGYLPTANVAFIDEVFKANSAILNTLLTLLNERLFDNGNTREDVPLVCLVGASNELPESEELDALYDRFLVRRQVRQVTAGGLSDLLMYMGNGAKTANNGSENGAASHNTAVEHSSEQPLLTLDMFARVKAQALSTVTVPREVVDLLVDLRSHLQDKCEPPVYVSDRRLVKAIALMQVAAYTNGRRTVTQYDCLLLQHVLWQRPDEAARIYDWLITHIAVGFDIQQVEFLLSGLFGRACKALTMHDENDVIRVCDEVSQLRETVHQELVKLGVSLEGGFPAVQSNLWLGREESDALASALMPKLQKLREEVERVLFEVTTLEVAVQERADAVVIASVMPKYWSNYIRNTSMDDARELGTVRSGRSKP